MPSRALGRGLRLHGNLVIHLDAGVVGQRPNYLVASSDNLVAWLHAVQNFYVGGAGNARFNLMECGLASGNYENSLNLFLAGLLLFRSDLDSALAPAFLLRLETALLPTLQRLYGNPLHTGPRAS